MKKQTKEAVKTEQQDKPKKSKKQIADEALDVMKRRNWEIERLHNFYDYSLTKSGELHIYINPLKMVNLLRRLGFYRYDQPTGGFEYVRIKDGKIHLIGTSVDDIQQIVDVFEDYIRELPLRTVELPYGDGTVTKEIFPEILLEKIYRGLNTYFSQTMPRLRPQKGCDVEEISIVHDTKSAKYIFYNNVVVRVTKQGREVIEYPNLQERIKEFNEDNGHYIWDTAILDRDYHRPENKKIGDFERFCMYICGATSDMRTEHVSSRMQCLKSILGYMLHDNYETNLKSALFIDAKIDDGLATGGTGKGIIGKALRAMANRRTNDTKYISVPGKGLDISKDTRYSNGDITTQMIHIEDTERKFNFEGMFNDVTEGAVFRKLHHDPTYHFCKIMLSTNCPFELNSESVRRRIILFELFGFFNAKRTPEDVFGHRLFESSWTTDDWALFDDFMISCVETYMSDGLVDCGELNYGENYLISELGSETYFWFKNVMFGTDVVARVESVHSIEKMWQSFNQKYPDKYDRRNSFSKACKKYLRTKKISSGILRSTEDLLIVFPEAGTNLTEIIYQDQ